MSYYMSDFYQNPPAAYGPGGSARLTEPGWGVLPQASGPRRLAVGAVPPGGPASGRSIGWSAEWTGDPSCPRELQSHGFNGRSAQCMCDYCAAGHGCAEATRVYEDVALRWCGNRVPLATRRLAVGQLSPAASLQPRYVASQERAEAYIAPRQGSAIPWWTWVAVPGVVVGVAALAYNQGWIGKK